MPACRKSIRKERAVIAVEKYKKKDMLQTVDTLLKANDAIVKTAASNPQGVAEALVQCQESAIALGTYIDTLDEKYVNLVHILEDYCENIYQISESLSDENVCRKVSKKIQKQLTGLQNGIKYDLPDDKKEIVFLPYKASMWDSLESVWKAAHTDPECDAYVIPIPYFDKNPDGSFRKEHYEGDQYPRYVPVTRYDEYDLEARHPDVIYIHNPYDECNHVTSVHPYFYSKNLRNYTDKLVYIPYFILGEIEPDNQAAIDGMKHFCFTPGTIYANQVIVQSENMRQIYINEYIKAAKEMGLPGEHVDRKFLEKKFLGTGSPKIDKVLHTKKEDLEIPAEWLRIIEKPDGSWKKIVFYNISVSALLKDEEKFLQKMESVFEIFKENRDGVALLWRPHPLIQATIESMRPKLWNAYKEIRDRYIEEGWGIYDDSADIDRSIVLSDAYYGVGSSSVVQLCKEAGMPVMVQDVNVLSERKEIVLSTYRIANIDQKIYFAAKNIFGFFMYDKEAETLEQIEVDSFALNEISSRFTFGGTCVYEGKVFFAPYAFSKGLLYDNEDMKIKEKIVMMDKLFPSEKRKNYCVKCAVSFEKWIYFIGHKQVNLLCLNMDTMQTKTIDAWQKRLQTHIETKAFTGINTGGDVCIVEDSFWVPINYDNYILEVNMRTQNTKIYRIQMQATRFSTICFDGTCFWLTGCEPIVVKWNKENGYTEVFNCFPKGFCKFQKNDYWEELFSRSFYENGYVYLFPLTANMILRVKTENGQMEKIYQWEVLKSCYTVEKWDENTFYIEVGDDNYIDINGSMLLDIDGNVLKRDIFTIYPKDVKYAHREKGMQDYVETPAFTVKNFIENKKEGGSYDQ